MIEVRKLEFDPEGFKCVLIIISFIPHSLFGMEHRRKGLHVGACFRVVERVQHCCFGLEIDGARVVEGGFLDGFAFNAELTEAVRVVSGVAIFPDGGVANRPVGRVLPDGFKH